MFQGLITQALQERKLLEITYVDAKGNHTIRVVEPYEIKEGKLFAHCIAKNGIRAFKLDSIVNMAMQPKTFEPRHEIKI